MSLLFRRKRRIRVHFRPDTQMEASIEGVLVRRGFRCLVLEAAVLLTGAELDPSTGTVAEGRQQLLRTVIPSSSVLMWEVL